MSRFFAASDDESESNSSQEEDSNDSGDDKSDVETKIQATKFGFESSDDDDVKRVVRTEKSKRYDELQTTVKALKNHMKINDWVSITTDFDNLQKNLAKARSITSKEGIPRFYVRACLSIEELCNATTAEKEKKMNSSNAKSLNIMRSKLRKWTKEYAAQINAYKANPLKSEDEEEEETKKPKAAKPAAKKPVEEKKEKKPVKKKKESDDEDEDEDEGDKDGEESDEESDDDDEDEADEDDESDDDTPKKVVKKKVAKKAGDGESSSEEWDEDTTDDDDVDLTSKDMFSRSFWVKRPETEEQKKKKEKKQVQKPVQRPRVQRRISEKEEKATRKDDDKVYTAELIMKKLKEIAAGRGKKGTNRQQVVDELRHLATKATTAIVSLKVKTTLVSALNDLTLNTMQYQPVETWKEVVQTLLEIVDLLDKNPDVRLSEDEEVKEAYEDDEAGNMTMEALMETEEQAEKKAEAERARRQAEIEAAGGPGVQHIKGNLYSFVQRCCSEFRSSLQHMSDPHQPDHVEKLKEYVDRLRDEALLLRLVTVCQAYYEKSQKMVFQRHTALLRLELIYYHYQPNNDHLTKDKTIDIKDAPEDLTISQLAHFLYKHGEDFEKTRALLCHVYYLAHHNRFCEARDLFLMSHVQDSINDADIRTRILFNRTMAQLGLSAFRLGFFDQALDSLMELFLSTRIKELLAQGVNQRFTERDAEKEKLERRRQYPAHMHINLDVLESVHLLSAMFVEVPNTAQNGQDNKRKVISKVFRRFLDYHQGKAFNGPPENTRDCVMAATTKLQRGDWKAALANVQRMKMWKLMAQSEVVFAKVKHKIQEVALRTYLLSYGPYYNSLSLAALCDMFELEEKECYRLCSKMMVSEKLQGAWDQPSKCIFMFAGATNNLQKAALQFSEKAELFLQQNEKLLESKFGHTFQHPRQWEGGSNYYNSSLNTGAGGGFARRGTFQRAQNYALGGRGM